MTKPALKKFIPLTKVDEKQRLVYGIATAEVVDKSGEICDYATAKKAYQVWSGAFEKNTNGKSLGNVREMHGDSAAGKVTSLTFNDEEKQVEICTKIVDDAAWNKVLEGVYTGFSQGGHYDNRWPDPVSKGVTRYTPEIVEVSLVDNPCVPTALFQVIKADGSSEMRKFTSVEEAAAAQAEADKTVETTAEKLTKALALVSEAVEGLEKKNKPEKTEAEADTATPAEKLSKLAKTDVWDVQCALDAILNIQCLIDSEKWQGMYTGTDQADQIADLKAALERLKSFIAKEIQEPDLANAAQAEALQKADKQKQDEQPGQDLQKAVKAEQDKTIAAEARATTAEAKVDELSKGLTTTLDAVETLTKRIKALEDQPAPAKGAVFAATRTSDDVQKAEDTKDEVRVPRHSDTGRMGMSPSEARSAFRTV